MLCCAVLCCASLLGGWTESHWIEIDNVKFGQVLRTLVLCSLMSTPEGGSVHVTVALRKTSTAVMKKRGSITDGRQGTGPRQPQPQPTSQRNSLHLSYAPNRNQAVSVRLGGTTRPPEEKDSDDEKENDEEAGALSAAAYVPFERAVVNAAPPPADPAQSPGRRTSRVSGPPRQASGLGAAPTHPQAASRRGSSFLNGLSGRFHSQKSPDSVSPRRHNRCRSFRRFLVRPQPMRLTSNNTSFSLPPVS